MGQKTHPRGFRLSINKDWQSHWHNDRDYRQLLEQDLEIRKYIHQKIDAAGIDELIISRLANEIQIDLKVARPGLAIGRGGAMMESIKRELNKLVGGKLRLNVYELPKPDLSPVIIAENIAGALMRRYPYKRAINSAMRRVMEAGAKGVKIFVSGRLGGNRIARNEKFQDGSVPTSTLSEAVHYAFREARTKHGTVGVKVWITQPNEQ